MTKLAKTFRGFMQEEEGAALVEYGLLVLLIAVLAILAIKGIGSKVNNGFANVNNQLPAVAP